MFFEFPHNFGFIIFNIILSSTSWLNKSFKVNERFLFISWFCSFVLKSICGPLKFKSNFGLVKFILAFGPFKFIFVSISGTLSSKPKIFLSFEFPLRLGLLILESRFISRLIFGILILILGCLILIFVEGKLILIFPLFNPDILSSISFPHRSGLIIFKSISSSISLANNALRVIAKSLSLLLFWSKLGFSIFKLILGLFILIPGTLAATLLLIYFSFGTLAFKTN